MGSVACESFGVSLTLNFWTSYRGLQFCVSLAESRPEAQMGTPEPDAIPGLVHQGACGVPLGPGNQRLPMFALCVGTAGFQGIHRFKR